MRCWPEGRSRPPGVPAPRAAGRGDAAGAGRGGDPLARPAGRAAAAGPGRSSASSSSGRSSTPGSRRPTSSSRSSTSASRPSTWRLAPRRRRPGQAAAEPDAGPAQGPAAPGGDLHHRVLRQHRPAVLLGRHRQRDLGRHAAGAAAPGGRHPRPGQGGRLLRPRRRQAEGPRHGADRSRSRGACRSRTR